MHDHGLEYCPDCAWETAASRARPASPPSEIEAPPKRLSDLTYEERLQWIAKRVSEGQPVSQGIVRERLQVTWSEAQRLMADDWTRYLPEAVR